MTNFRNAMMAAAHTASGVPVVSVGNSALFDASASTDGLSYTTDGSGFNQKTFTLSTWFYLGSDTSSIGGVGWPIFASDHGSANSETTWWKVRINTNGTLVISNWDDVTTTQVFRDIGWYNLVIAADTTQSTAADRYKVYVNGERITSFSSTSYPSQNIDLAWGEPSEDHWIGNYDNANYAYNGYLAETVFKSGSQLGPESFGEFDSTGTFWTPLASTSILDSSPTFYLDNATNPQTDASGNGINWTNNGSIATSTHTPTNINTLMNPLSMFQGMSLANGNNKVTFTAAAYTGNIFTIPIPPTGKWKMEVDMTAITGGLIRMGIIEKTEYSPKNMATNIPFDHVSLGNPDFNTISTSGGNASAIGKVDGTAYNYASEANGSRVVSNGDRWAFYYDADSGKFWAANDDGSGDTTYFYEDSGGTAGNPATGSNPLATSNTSKSYQFYVTGYSDPTANRNFLFKEEADWILTTPTGYAPLTTANIASATTRTKSNLEEYFDTTLYEGSGSEQNVVSSTTDNTSAFSWIKNRDAIDNHMLFDRVRGATKDLHSNSNATEVTNAQTVKAFIGGGVTLGTDNEVNTNNESYVLWNWMVETAGTGSSNTDGTINTTSTLVDTNLGLSISKYTGTGANATVGHGLGVAPEFIAIKNLDQADHWLCYHSGIGNTKALFLSLNNAADTNAVYFNNTSPTSSVFSLGSGDQGNSSGEALVAYCFAPSQFTAIGSYVGNGNANGTFVPTVNSLGVPIQPAWWIMKRTDNTSGWNIVDTSRDSFNEATHRLEAQATSADNTANGQFDLVSGGFKFRNTNTDWDGSGASYIYMAFGTPIIDVDGRILGGR